MLDVEMTVSGEFFNLPAVQQAIITSMDEVIAEALKDFNATKATFSARSQFDFTVRKATLKGDAVEGGVWTDNENYVRLNNGTGVRPRTARTPKGMSFRNSYRPKTGRGRVGSGGSSRGGRWVSGIKHVKSGPIQAREFDTTIKKSRGPDLYTRVNKALAQFTK